jgi:hypothetical protein
VKTSWRWVDERHGKQVVLNVEEAVSKWKGMAREEDWGGHPET